MTPFQIRTGCDRRTGQATLTRLPTSSTSLVFAVLPDGDTRLMVMGPRTHASYFPTKEVATVNADFRPGWARVLTGVPVSELADRVVPLSDLWGEAGAKLHSELTADPVNAARHMEKALAERVTDNPGNDLVHEATRWLSTERLPETARRLNVSERHLRTLFTSSVGVSPKRYVQLNRVRTVLEHARKHKGARLALDSGYYDQSHMTAEFRATMGVPLSRFLAGDLQPDSAC